MEGATATKFRFAAEFENLAFRRESPTCIRELENPVPGISEMRLASCAPWNVYYKILLPRVRVRLARRSTRLR